MSDAQEQKTELLPCPFCGGKPAWGEGEQKIKYGNEQVYCSVCYAMTPPEMTIEEAARNWNWRSDTVSAGLRRKFIRPMEALTPSYLEQKECAGTIGKFFWCVKCKMHAIANNVCANCGKDDRALRGDFLFDPDLSINAISHHQQVCVKFALPLYVHSEITVFDIPESVDVNSTTSILNYLRQTATSAPLSSAREDIDTLLDHISALKAQQAVLVEALRAITDFCDDPEGSDKPETLAEGLARLLPAARTALAQVKEGANKPRILECADCGQKLNPDDNHSCRQQRKRNKR